MAKMYEAIATVNLSTSTSTSIEFTSIPSVYTHLEILHSGRSTGAAFGQRLSFNGTTTGYGDRYLQGYGNGIESGSNAVSQGIYAGQAQVSSSTTSTFTNGRISIPNYAGSKFKGVLVDHTTEANGTVVYNDILCGLWSNTAAITSIKLSGGTYAQYSTFTLYGVR